MPQGRIVCLRGGQEGMSSEPRNESQTEKERGEAAVSNLITLAVGSRGSRGVRRRKKREREEGLDLQSTVRALLYFHTRQQDY